MNPSTSPSSRFRVVAPAALALALAVALGLTRFLFLGHGELQDWDEAMFAWRAKVCVHEGAWLDQHHHSVGDPDLPEGGFYSGAFPPLYVWATAALYKVFGFSEWASRFWAAAAGAGCAVLVFMIGRRLAGDLCGFLSALFLGAIPYFCRYSRLGQVDVPYIFFVLCVIYLALEAHRTRRRAYWVWAGVALGLGLMTKIAVALMAPAVIGLLTLYRVRTRELKWRALFTEQAVVLGVAVGVAAPWHIAMSLQWGRVFWWWTFAFHLFGKASQAQDLNQGGPLFYFNEIAERTPSLIWALAAAGALAGIGTLVRKVCNARAADTVVSAPSDPSGDAGAPALRHPFHENPANPYALPLLWLLLLLIGFSASATKRSTYTLAMYPPLCLLAALWAARVIESPWLRRLTERFNQRFCFPGLPRQNTATILITLVLIAGVWQSGLRRAFQPSAFKDAEGWQGLAGRLDRRDYDAILAIGAFTTNRAIYYLNGANAGWAENIRYVPIPFSIDRPGATAPALIPEDELRNLKDRLARAMTNASVSDRPHRVILLARLPIHAEDARRLETVAREATGLAQTTRSGRLLLLE